MSLPHQPDKIGFNSVEAQEEGSDTSNDLNRTSLSQPPSPRKKTNIDKGVNWKRVLRVGVVVLIIGLFLFYINYVHLGLSKIIEQRLDRLEAKIREQRKENSLGKDISEHLVDEVESHSNQTNTKSPKFSTTSMVVDVEYASKEFGVLPISLFAKNGEGKTIEEALYDEAARKHRKEFIEQRGKFVESKPEMAALQLAKYNLASSEQQQKKAVEDNQKDWLRLQAKFQLSKVKEELPMCIVVPGFNNNADFRIEGNLNSVFTQNYTNYKVVIVNDASNDGSNKIYRNYFSFHGIDKQRYVYVENEQRVHAVHNYYYASLKHCAKDSVIIMLDGDDELIGRNVLQVFNWAYQTKKAGVVYSNFYWLAHPKAVLQGFSSSYSDEQMQGNLYREVVPKFSQLRSFRAQLAHQIDPKDLQDQDGAFFTVAGDVALMLPLMELSCSRVYKIEGEFHYLYKETGHNDNGAIQNRVDKYLRKQKKYECYKEFDEKMKKFSSISSEKVQQTLKNTNVGVYSVVVDVEYSSKEFGPLPINFFAKNKEGKTIDEIIYNEATRKQRKEFIQERIRFIESKPNFLTANLAKYNFASSEQHLKKGIEDNRKDWLRLEAKFGLSRLKEELPMCIIMPGYNNNAKFRIEGNLNSVFTQNYTNYKVVIINDASTDGSNELYRNYFNFYAIDKKHYVYVENSKRSGTMHNLYYASLMQCSKQSVVLNLDADDQLIGRNVLQVFNWAYQAKKAGVVYSNFYHYQQSRKLAQGFTTQYSEQQKKGNTYRDDQTRFSHLRSYRAELAHQLNIKSLQDDKGVFFSITADFAIMVPLMELACGRVHKIQGQFHYLYNENTGLNDYLELQKQLGMERYIRKLKKQECFKEFDDRMVKLPSLPERVDQMATFGADSVVVDIEYASKNSFPLPIDMNRKNSEGKRIDEVLYDEATRKKRNQFIQERSNTVKSRFNLPNFFFAKYNLIGNEEDAKQAIRLNQRDWLRLQAKFQLSKIKEELPMCIVVPGYNNMARFRLESSLNSAFTQNYTNYKVVAINDASTDGSEQIYRNYFAFHGIDKQRYVYVENAWRAFAVHNYYYASLKHCAKDSVIIMLDGDDELIGRNVLQVFNWAYQTKKAGVVYSNFFIFEQSGSVREGWTAEYESEVKQKGSFRSARLNFNHLLSVRNELVFQVDPKDLKDKDGAFLAVVTDMAFVMPLTQLSCGRVHKIEGEVNYLFNVGTGLNDNQGQQGVYSKYVLQQKPYQCHQPFEEKMKNLPSVSNQTVLAITGLGRACVVIDVEYSSKEFGPLPINLFAKNQEGKTIDEIIYNEATRKQRKNFIEERTRFVDSKHNSQSIKLAKYNLVNSEEQQKMSIEDNQREWRRLEAKLGLSRLKEQLPMCIIMPGFNNNANFRIEGNLNSVFTQNYTNFKVIILNDASTDSSHELYLNYFNFYAIDKKYYVYVENAWRAGTLHNLYYATMKHCAKQAVVLNLDADDQLIGRNVLQVFNWAYQAKKAGVVYSNFYFYQQSRTLGQGFTTQYSDEQKKGNRYRDVQMKFSHLRSYRGELAHQLDPKDLQDDNRVFYAFTADQALILPLLQLACGRVSKIEGEFHYLYNVETGLNDYKTPAGQNAVFVRVRKQKKYQCYKEFDERMNKLPALTEFTNKHGEVGAYSMVIDVEYASKEFGALPINLFGKNKEGKTIEEALYDEAARKQRKEFIEQRGKFVSSKPEMAALQLAKYNLASSEEQQKKAVEDNQKDWLRLQAKFQLSKIKEELPMCIVVPGYNNMARFRLESSLNSAFTQNYTNYKVVAINDASTDGSEQIYRNYFAFHGIDKQRYAYIENAQRVHAVHNYYYASLKHCAKDSVIIMLDGDDELIGRNVLQVFNWAYQTKKAGVVYSNFFIFEQSGSVREGWTAEYESEVKQKGSFRSVPLRFNHLLSVRNELVFQVDPKDLKDKDGAFLAVVSDMAFALPLTQLSCGRVHKVEGEVNYLFNVGTGLNDNDGQQAVYSKYVLQQKPYKCHQPFEEKMKK